MVCVVLVMGCGMAIIDALGGVCGVCLDDGAYGGMRGARGVCGDGAFVLRGVGSESVVATVRERSLPVRVHDASG
jgi:hypothetical protein